MHELKRPKVTCQIDLTTAIKIFVVLATAMLLFIGCARIEQQSPPPLTNQQTEATPIAQMSASEFPSLAKQDLIRLDERFPEHQRGILQNAKHIDLFEIRDCLYSPVNGVPDNQGLWPIERSKFQNCQVSRHTRVSDDGERKELVEGILYSVGSSGNGAACFSPRHAFEPSTTASESSC